MADASPHLLSDSTISCHAWNGDRTLIAICPGNSELHIFKVPQREGSEWEKIYTLQKHDQLISSVDWAPKSGRLLTCSHDRNVYVWEKLEGTDQSTRSSGGTGQSINATWHPSLVILHSNRAALCAAWSPLENKFAVGSGAKTVSICFYDAENSWWVGKVVKKKHSSSITSVSWHPNNMLIATTCMDGKCRVFSANIKGVDSRSDSSSAFVGSKFGEQLLQLDLAFGWTFGAQWSPSGNNLAFVGHDSSIHFINDVGPALTISSLSLRHLPLRDVLFLSEKLVVAVGFDCSPLLFSSDALGKWSFVRMLDDGKPSANMSPSSKFSEAVKAFDARGGKGDGGGGRERGRPPLTVHQDCITSIRALRSNHGDEVLQSFSTSGLDGRLVVWDISGLHLANVVRDVHL